MIFAQNVARIKRETGFNLTQMEQATGISRKTISRILTHTRSRVAEYIPSYSTVQSFAKSLGLTVEDVTKRPVSIVNQGQ
jgi:transcriptional regulator with XRE-family HTH domain